MSHKRKADCTPEEWEKISTKIKERIAKETPEQREKRLAYQKGYRKSHPYKKKSDYTEEEWEEKKKKRKIKHKSDYTEEEWEHIKQIKKRWSDKNKDYHKIYYQQNKHVLLLKQKEYVKNNLKRVKQRRHNYYINNKEEILKKQKTYIEANKDKINKRKKLYEIKNKEAISKMKYKYVVNNLEKVKESKKMSAQSRKLLFSKWKDKLTPDEDPVADENGFLMVRDYHTKEYFYPTRKEVSARVYALNHDGAGECHLYSSEKTKHECLVYNSHSTRKNPKRRIRNNGTSAFWRKTVIERANGHCERCGKASNVLHAHHIIPKSVCGMFEADFDNGIALCPECHLGEGGVHDIDGCRLHELAAEKRETA